MITPASINEVKNSPIFPVVNTYVHLKRKGANHIGCCPFHNEKTGSFTVSQAKNMYKCFGCGESGNAITFVMKKDVVDFPTAIKTIAKINNIKLEYEEIENKEEYQQRQTLYQQQYTAVEYAANFYQQQLLSLPTNHPVVQYLYSRGFTNYTIIKWKLGWCNESWQQITEKIKTYNLLNAANILGIVSTGKDGSHYDTFRSRIIFPIKNSTNQIVGLAGRWHPLTEKDKSFQAPKYLNTKSTPESIYQKEKELYGLHIAKHSIAKLNSCNTVEGYADVIAMHKYGQQNTVASCGTAFTEAQANKILSITKNITIFPDYEENKSGENAAIKNIDLLIQKEADVKMAIYNKKDIAELICA